MHTYTSSSRLLNVTNKVELRLMKDKSWQWEGVSCFETRRKQLDTCSFINAKPTQVLLPVMQHLTFIPGEKLEDLFYGIIKSSRIL